MNKQLIVLASVLFACVLYSSHSASTLLLCGGCGCNDNCDLHCNCGPCVYDTQSNGYNG